MLPAAHCPFLPWVGQQRKIAVAPLSTRQKAPKSWPVSAPLQEKNSSDLGETARNEYVECLLTAPPSDPQGI